MIDHGRGRMTFTWALLVAACVDDPTITSRDDAEPPTPLDSSVPALDVRLHRDTRAPSSPPDRGATLADATLPDLRLADVLVVADIGRTLDSALPADAVAIPQDAAPAPVPCVPVPHVGDVPVTAQQLLRNEANDPRGHTYFADSFLSCGDNWFSVNTPVSGDRACLIQYVVTATPPPHARLESFERSDPLLACLEDADCARAGPGFTCEGTFCMRGVGALISRYLAGGRDDPSNSNYYSVDTVEIARGTTIATPLLFRVSIDTIPPAGDVSHILDLHFASESFGCPYDWREELEDLPFIARRGAVCDRWLCPGESTDRFLTETGPDGVQAVVLMPKSPADELELRAGPTAVRVPGADRLCIVLRGVERTSEGIVTVARQRGLGMDLADYTLVYDQAPDADPATLCVSLGAPALDECPPGTVVADDCWPVVDVDDAQF
jgi:hypothetical protein